MEYSIVPVHLVVKSMRDNGYKNTAFAIAELIDNSIQHGATLVEMICLEKDLQLNLKTVSRIDKIAILDNGDGMTKEKLQMALQFGNGTNLNKESQTGIGKFGMGLPSSSISQAKRVDVWSWIKESKEILHTYLDIEEIISGKMSTVPEPTPKDIPSEWIAIAEDIKNSGTLVVWSELDRCLWRTGKTIIDHSEYTVGRMYRKFLSSGEKRIKASVAKTNSLGIPTFTKEFLANDPMYLMENTSVSELLNNANLPDPMFEMYGGEDGYEKSYDIHFNDEDHKVYVRYSIAKEISRKGRNAGGLPHGKHAGNNIGVSILRAGRELDLDTSWVIGYDPRERWWGIEVEFPPALDEVFGVTNNKQFANNFKELGHLDINQLLNERGQNIFDLKKELLEENDFKGLLIDIAKDIKNQLKLIRENIEAQAKRLEKPEKNTRHIEKQDEVEQHATQVTKVRLENNYIGQSDKDDEKQTQEEKLAELTKELAEDSIPEAALEAEKILNSGVKYQFIEAIFESHAFFSVAPKGGKIIIKLNTTHPAYNQFVEVLNDDVEVDVSIETVIKRLNAAKDGMKLLLMAWARFEDEQPDGPRKTAVKDARIDWGRMAAEFMALD